MYSGYVGIPRAFHLCHAAELSTSTMLAQQGKQWRTLFSHLSFTEKIRKIGPLVVLYALLSRVLVAFPQHHIPWAALVSTLVSLLDFKMKYLAWLAGCTRLVVPVIELTEE